MCDVCGVVAFVAKKEGKRVLPCCSRKAVVSMTHAKLLAMR